MSSDTAHPLYSKCDAEDDFMRTLHEAVKLLWCTAGSSELVKCELSTAATWDASSGATSVEDSLAAEVLTCIVWILTS